MIFAERNRGSRGQAAFIRGASKGVYADARLYRMPGAGASGCFASRAWAASVEEVGYGLFACSAQERLADQIGDRRNADAGCRFYAHRRYAIRLMAASLGS